MFRLGADLKVYLHREPIDFRAGINSLAVLVQETMALDPFAPAVFAFCNRRRDRMKLLFFDRSGFVLVLKRDRGQVPVAAPGGSGGHAYDRAIALLGWTAPNGAPKCARVSR
ncbi:IS66 family insertion sequence element accessory protein TnpB [Mesorhizobium sp. LSHC412B00]|uniref:IS66 family insertion sequence element accessory protein TnpB n=1 Tax=Mesorhizobium sp. LSHC412B00 TaxID=1287285 RepID=UPI0004291D4D|nr:IS66 family insertion sequence element accessory protein TnpB [Mesorhizobium sp. LSHC412B00]